MDTHQRETLDYFRKHAQDWSDKADGLKKDSVNIIEQRNDYVIKVIQERESTNTALDVGCGTGDLICDIASKGIDATGIDFAKEMIDIAKKKKISSNLSHASFICQSIFDYQMTYEHFDIISANGFIEYISLDMMVHFFKIAYSGLKPNGSFIVGSRNRLFNLFSLNTFTEQELKLNSVNTLIKESIAINNLANINELLNLPNLDYQTTENEQTNTGVTVSIRYQYTPSQLLKILTSLGFKGISIYPVHYHAFPPSFIGNNIMVHVNISNLLQGYADTSLSLIPQASTFMIHVMK